MSSVRHVVASLAAAGVALSNGAVAAGAAEPLEQSTDKYIAGVPVFNYDQAYGDQRDSFASAAAREGGWIVVLEPGDRGDAIQSMCSLSKRGCTVKGDNPKFPFIALRGTEQELASVVERSREVSRFIDVDMTMREPPLEELAPLDEREVQAAEERGGVSLWNLDRIGAYNTTRRGAGVHVYVLDTGIRTDHVEFEGRAVAWLDMFNDTHTSTRFCNETRDEDCAGDVRGHGTHCAGTVAGKTYGVAPQAMVYAVKVLSNQGSGETSGILFAMEKVALEGQLPAIVSMSLGGSRNLAYKAAVDELVHAGVTVVVAAGNEYTDACKKSPAFVPNAITVGSTASTDARSDFSNWGPCIDIWAPGSDIVSADASEGKGPNDESTTKSGTSMACPHVAGAAALLLGESSAMSPGQIRDSLRGSASENFITDLSPFDENLFLYVGNDLQSKQPPQDTSDWPSDEFFQSCSKNGQDGPRGDFPVCMCSKRVDRNPEGGTRCYDGPKLGCPLGAALTEIDNSLPDNPLSHWYYLANCTTCFCLEEAPAAKAPEAPGSPYMLIISVTVAVVLAGVAVYCYSTSAKSESLSDPIAVEVTA